MSKNQKDSGTKSHRPPELKEICVIVAAGLNHAIGKNNQLLWHLPNDLRYFKNATWTFPVIMGRKTFEAIGKALPGRVNIVISRNENRLAEGISPANSLDEALKLAVESGCKKAFIIGGGEIYRQALPLADRILMTRVQASPDADTFFPEIDPNVWTLNSSEAFEADEKHPQGYVFEDWILKPAEQPK
jgi:dihydrofolate reductase